MLATDEFKLLGSSPVLILTSLYIGGWLWSARAPALAAWWVTLFVVGLAVAAASQIAFIGWGMQIAFLDFQGFSGHAMRTTAVFPVLFYLLFYDAATAKRQAAIATGVLIGALMAVSVCRYDTHSVSESLGGFIIGAFVSFAFIRIGQAWTMLAISRMRRYILLAGHLLIAVSVAAVGADPSYRWLNQIALYLSGQDLPYTRTTVRW